MDRIAAWHRLLSPAHAELRRAAAACDPGDVGAVARLRRLAEAETAGLALALAAARRKATAKFPGLAERLVADPEAVEQASSWAVAQHKAGRFAALSRGPVVDLCCGVGGDAMGLAASGLDTVVVDRDPVRVWQALGNAQLAAAHAGRTPRLAGAAGDVQVLPVRADGLPLHLDPARRSGAGRAWRLADYRPGPAAIARLLGKHPDAAVKLSPGIDFAELDALLTAVPRPGGPWRWEVELIGEAGRLVQAVLWTGRLAGEAPRSATRLEPGADGGRGVVHTLSGTPIAAPLAEPGRYLLAVDPAIERAGLLGHLAGRLGLAAVHPALGLLTAERPVVSPWLTAFELVECLPYRVKKLRAWLGAHDGGIVEVKTRGKAADPDRLAAELRGPGSTPWTVFVLRLGRVTEAWMTRRV